MLKLSQLISLPLINLYSKKVEGYIENIYINPERKKMAQLIIYNENEDSYYTVNYEDIYKFGRDCVFITNSSKMTLYENLEAVSNTNINSLNSDCYDIDGNYFGKVTDITINNRQIYSILVNNNEYLSSAICGLNSGLTILSLDKKINLKRFRQASKKVPTIKKSEENPEPIVTILKQNNIAPSREITNYNFLLNRLVLKDIKNQSGEIIANKNTLVTLNTIQKLKYYGKLKELMFNSKSY